MILEFILILSASIISFIAGFLMGKKKSKSFVPTLIVGFSLLACNILPRVFTTYFYWLFPPFLLGEIILACAFMASGMLFAKYCDSLFRGIIQSILFLLMLYFVLFPPTYLALYGNEIKSMNYGVKDGVTIQTSYFGCLPSSLSTIFRTYGLEYTEGELAYALRTTTMGTDFSRVPTIVKEFGHSKNLKATFIKTSIEELRELGKPAVLDVKLGRIRHATALLGFDGDKVILGEPLEGIKKIKIDDFQNETMWTGLAIVISNN